MPPTPQVNCKKCGEQLLDPNIRFCSSCGSEQNANPQWKVGAATSDVGVVKGRIKTPSIALIIAAGINLLFCFVILVYLVGMTPTDQALYAIQKVAPIVSILLFAAFGFSIYGAIQMMNLRKYGFAMTSAIIMTLSPIFTLVSCASLLALPVGIWALVILRQPEIKRAFDEHNAP